ncbi:MAG: hypothetical protein FWG44_00530 [Oscillospiraceae bacterium]|nr:hypothetical protein [Oscillospiraceae bacterium]
MKKILSILVIVALAAMFTISVSALTSDVEVDGDTVKVYFYADEDGDISGSFEVAYGDGLAFDFVDTNSRAGDPGMNLWAFNEATGLLAVAGTGFEEGDLLATFELEIIDADGDIFISFVGLDGNFDGIEIEYDEKDIDLEPGELVDPGTTDPGTTDPGTTDPGTTPEIEDDCECELCDTCGGCIDADCDCTAAGHFICEFGGDHNPPSGVVFAVIPALMAAGAAVVTRKRK